jgi:CheY-like chemotaxis protein/anti-sigma regulatory factor (Ser/Thr protein kinase)
VLEAVTDLLAVQAFRKGLELACVLGRQVPTCLRGDPARLRQVLVNLVGNAVKFTHRGEVCLRVALERESEAEVMLRFEVRDTGIGIPADKMPLLFRAFSQADSSTTRRYGGTGLGLAISKQLVELMGGKIDVESQPGRGSTFRFVTGFSRKRLLPGDSFEPAPLPPGTRVLVVDRHEATRLALREQLGSLGGRSVEESSWALAKGALRDAAAAGRPFRAALVELAPPGDGVADLACRIGEDSPLRDTALILLSQRRPGEETAYPEGLHSAALLIKPVKLAQLRERLAEALGQRPGSAEEAGEGTGAESGPRSEPGPGRQVLVVEDNRTNQLVIVRLLERLGCRVDVAADGAEAVRAVKAIRYDLIFMDVQMPEMDGFAATGEIRRLERETGRHVPIVAMTAHAMEGDRERCLLAGMDDYLAKPLQREDIVAVLERRLASPEPGLPSRPGARTGGPAPVFDRAGLLLRLEQDEALLEELVSLFVAEAPLQVQRLLAALRVGDSEGVRRHAHQLKGAAASVGAEALRDLAMQIEAASGPDLSEASGLAQGLIEALRAFQSLAAGGSDAARLEPLPGRT